MGRPSALYFLLLGRFFGVYGSWFLDLGFADNLLVRVFTCLVSSCWAGFTGFRLDPVREFWFEGCLLLVGSERLAVPGVGIGPVLGRLVLLGMCQGV